MSSEKCKYGRLEVIIGGMFTGKTTELIRRLLVEAIADRDKVLYVNHSLDTRSDGDFSSHNVLFHNALPEESGVRTLKTHNLRTVLQSEILQGVRCIGIDEGQFFPELFDVVIELVEVHHKHVIVAVFL